MSDIEGPWVSSKPEKHILEVNFVTSEPITVTRCILTDPNKSKSVWLLESVGIDHYQLIAAYNSEEAANKALSRAENKVIRSSGFVEMVVYPNTVDRVGTSLGDYKIIEHARQMLPEYLTCDFNTEMSCSNEFRIVEVKTKGRK